MQCLLLCATLNLGLRCPVLRSPPATSGTAPSLYDAHNSLWVWGNQTEMTVVHVELYHFMSFILYSTNTQGYTGTIRLCWRFGEIVVLLASLLMIVCRIQGTVFPKKFFSPEFLRISYWLPFSTVSMLPMYCLASFLCSYFCTIWGTRHMDTCKTYTPSISSYHSTKSSHEHHGDSE